MAITQTESLQTNIATFAANYQEMGAAAVGTKVYLFGGSANKWLNTIQEFDTATNAISTLSATLQKQADGIGAAAVGTKIYLFGGGGTEKFDTIQVFDTETNTVSTLSAKLPKGSNFFGTAAVGTKVYLFGGSAGGSSGNLNTIQVFDTETNTISTLSATLPTAAYNIGAAVVGTKIYLFGGRVWLSSGVESHNTIRVFDTATNAISTLSATLPTAAYSIGAAAVGTKIYLFGGSGSSTTNTIQVFDTETNTVSTLSMTLPTATSGIGTVTIGTKVYLCGGVGVNTISCYAPEGTFADVEEPEETATVITYNGSTIATLEAGQKATIKTAETEVDHDIIITPVFPIEIAYGDIGIIGTAEAGQTAIIRTANTEIEHDIVISAKAEEVTLEGTWILNETLAKPPVMVVTVTGSAYTYLSNTSVELSTLGQIRADSNGYFGFRKSVGNTYPHTYYPSEDRNASFYARAFNISGERKCDITKDSEYYDEIRTFTIDSVVSGDSDILLEYLKANATKQ